MKLSLGAFLSVVLLSTTMRAEARQGQEVSKPGPQHEALKQFEGTWDAVASFMTEPGKNMAESKGVETASVGLGGFWLCYEFKGEMLGTPFTGRGTMGYDQQKHKYVGTWIDSAQSGLFISEGTGDESGKVFTLMVRGYCDKNGKEIVMKHVMEIKDKDRRTLTFLTPNPDGKELVTGTIEYVRRR